MARSGKKKASGSARRNAAKAKAKVADAVEDAEIISEHSPDETATEPTEVTRPDTADEAEAVPAADEPQTAPSDELSDSGDQGPPPPVAEPGKKPRGSVLPLAFGGLVAGAIGFGASQYLGNDNWPFAGKSPKREELVALVSAQKEKIDSLSAQIAELSKAIADAPKKDQLDAVAVQEEQTAAAVETIKSSVSDLTQRVGDLEMRPVPDGSADAQAVAAYEKQLTAMREMFQKELERIEKAQESAQTVQAEAAKKAQQAALGEAMAQLQAAASGGKPFAEPLARLEDMGIEPPDVLKDAAEKGIVSLARLQEEFPAAARAALVAATRQAEEAGETSKLTAFLRTQLGARSLEPRDGNDPDAILSRAEAALKNADVEGALAEISNLPDAGKEKMAGWVKLADKRLTAEKALQELAAQSPKTE